MNKILSTQWNTTQSWKGKTTMDESQKRAKWEKSDTKKCILCARMRACMLSHFNHVWLFATLWTIASQAPRFMGFCRQEYWSGLPCRPPGDLPDPKIKSASLTSSTLADGFFTTSVTRQVGGRCNNWDHISFWWLSLSAQHSSTHLPIIIFHHA